MLKLKEKPQIEFIVSLHKIKDAYFRYYPDGYKEIDGLTSFYNSKSNYSDEDLITLQVRCEDEWNKLIIKICDVIINKIENNKKREKIYSKELKNAKIKKEQIKSNHLTSFA